MKSLLLHSVISIVGIGALVQASGAAPTEKKAQNWSTQMRELEKNLSALLVDLSSDERFNNRSNFKRIQAHAEKIAKVAHEIKSTRAPDQDPTLGIISRQFASETKHAYQALMTGNRQYAREVLRTIPGYCISCHTRTGTGPQFASSSIQPPLKGLDLAEFLTSSRQFDRALDEYQRIIQQSNLAETQPFEWERAVRTALSIAIRVKKDPDTALKIIESVLSESKAPYFTRQKALSWKKSVQDWKNEAPQRAATAEGLYSLAIRLTSEAKNTQKFPADRSADVLYLRASSVIHELLNQPTDATRGAEALYLAGLNYEVLRDLNLGEIHDFYYLGCILKSPHSEISRLCFSRYQESVQLGFTGSAGTMIPGEVLEKLKQLEKLSDPENAPGSKKKLEKP